MELGMVKVSVKQALERVASAPPLDENADYTELRVHELVARALFDIANDPNPRKPGAMARATKAQRMILDRMVGTRKPEMARLHELHAMSELDKFLGVKR